jgi:hypothetical protein
LIAEQTKLLEKYKEIEGLPDWPLLIDIPKNQIILKDFTSRTVEELMEALEYLVRLRTDDVENAEELTMLMEEEVIDALHFYLDLLILIGPDKFSQNLFETAVETAHEELPGLANLAFNMTYMLFLSRNQLKNKPWKQTPIPTDIPRYIDLVEEAGVVLSYMLREVLGYDSEKIYSQYMKKHTVNQFRQKSKY